MEKAEKISINGRAYAIDKYINNFVNDQNFRINNNIIPIFGYLVASPYLLNKNQILYINKNLTNDVAKTVANNYTDKSLLKDLKNNAKYCIDNNKLDLYNSYAIGIICNDFIFNNTKFKYNDILDNFRSRVCGKYGIDNKISIKNCMTKTNYSLKNDLYFNFTKLEYEQLENTKQNYYKILCLQTEKQDIITDNYKNKMLYNKLYTDLQQQTATPINNSIQIYNKQQSTTIHALA